MDRDSKGKILKSKCVFCGLRGCETDHRQDVLNDLTEQIKAKDKWIKELLKEVDIKTLKLHALEEERNRTVEGYAKEQLDLLKKITALEAKNREVKRMNREEGLILEAKLCELEKIAREGLSECFCGWGKVHPETCPNCINLKKINELMGEKNENN